MVVSVAPNRRGGFTLIELSIVLVVIGLLIGGILVGRDMIRNTQGQSVITTVQTYMQVDQQFQEKYGAWPGDMANATAYWGVAGGNAGDNYTASCYALLGSGPQTCNGNGNGRIGFPGFNNDASSNEMFRAWQHLANAGFIQGSYTGVAGSVNAETAVIGSNVPASKLKGAGFSIKYEGIWAAGDANLFPGNYGHALFFGAQSASTGWETLYPVLTTQEASSTDQKIDDGLPGSGNVMSLENGSYFTPACITSGNAATARYALSSGGSLCSLIFITGF